MNRPLLALGVTLGLLLVGCGPKDTPATDDDSTQQAPRSIEDIDACGGLDAATVTDLVGEPVVLGEGGGMLPTCDFVGVDGGPGSFVQVLALPMGGAGGFADFAEVIDTQRTNEDELEVEEVDVPGADQAALVDDLGYGLASTTLVAIADGIAYTVYPAGVTRDDQSRVATAALTVVLGGELPDGSAIEPRDGDVCTLVADDALSTALRIQVTSEASSVADSQVCTWSGEGVGITVIDSGSTSRIESLARLGSDDGSTTATPLDLGPAVEAYVTESEFGTSGYVTVDHRLYSVDVGQVDADERGRVLQEVITAIAAGA